jgi:hypothetical protein
MLKVMNFKVEESWILFFFKSASGDADFGSYRRRRFSAFGADDKVEAPLVRVYMI